MNLLKLFIGIGAVVFSSSAFADDSQLAFHIDCVQASSACIELQFASGDGKTILVKKEPEMTISQNQISEAEIVKSEYGQDELHLRLEKSAAEKFGQVTGSNIGKRLIVVANSKALIAPNIQQVITGGSLVISAGMGNGNKYLDGLPWLKKMAEGKKANKESWSLFSMISFLILGLFIVGGSIYFAFFKKRSPYKSVSS